MESQPVRTAKIREYEEAVNTAPTSAVYAEMMGRPGWAPVFWRIPEHMHPGIARWVMFGVVPGAFLQAVLRHDLISAAAYADDTNRKLLWEYAFVLQNAMPMGSHGPGCLDTWKGVWPAEDTQ